MTENTKIDILAGAASDSAWGVPKTAQTAGLCHRVAVVQHTYRADKVDMYFDRQLWERILEFALHFRQGAEVCIAECQKSSTVSVFQRLLGLLRGLPVHEAEEEEIRPDVFLAALREKAESEQEPPEFIWVRDKKECVLCIATEYWAHVGGPGAYHDSYTYSIFSKSNVAADVRAFLVEAEAAKAWEIH
jgi:hypothetical protein